MKLRHLSAWVVPVSSNSKGLEVLGASAIRQLSDAGKDLKEWIQACYYIGWIAQGVI